MATTLNVSSGFNGSLAGELFVQAFKKADTINKGAITILPNVIGSGYLPKLSYSAGLQAYTCGWNPSGTVDYSDKEIVTRKFTIQHELCKNEFHATFQAQAQGLFAADNDMPATIQEGILVAMVDNMAAIVENQIWSTSTGSTTTFNGLLSQFLLDSDVIDVSGTTVTPSNVFAEIGKTYDAIPAEIEEDETLIIAVSRNVAKAYKRAQAALLGMNFVGDKELDYLGTKMVSLVGLPADTMVAYRVKNLAFATGLEADLNEVRISDDENRLDGNIRTKMTFSAGVGYSFGNEIVWYSK